MAKGNMTIRMEPELKAQAAALFKSLGMDLSTATGIFYRQALRCHGLPFEVKVDEPNAVTYAAMEAAEKGEDMYGPFDSVADLMEALNAKAGVFGAVQTRLQACDQERLRSEGVGGSDHAVVSRAAVAGGVSRSCSH